MIRLYASGGSQEVDLVDRRMKPEAWDRTRETTARLLTRRGFHHAADLLRTVPFELWEGTNGFGDEFSVLYAELPLDRYLPLADMEHDAQGRLEFRRIAGALDETEAGVRFIVASLSDEFEPSVVPAPDPATTTGTLERALAEVERSLADGRPAAGVDRIHTALHAYLRALAESAGLRAGDLGPTDLFRVLRQSHPGLQPLGPRAADITRILSAIATIIDSLNPIRNRASLAHPAEALLPDPEAMLVINAVRTLLHYLETRVRSSGV